MPLLTTQSARGYGFSSLVEPVSTAAYESIATQSVGAGGLGTITFSSIPGTYKHLELRYLARTTHNGLTYGKVSANGDTTSGNYTAHDLFGTGSGNAIASFYGNQTGFAIQKFSGADAATGIFGAGVLTILDYSNTSKYKTGRNLGGTDYNGSGELDFVSGVWFNAASAITSLSIVPSSGSFVEYSRFALYGIKG